MTRDEVGTLTRLKAYRAIVDELIASHRGRIFNTAGDSVVADFVSAVDTVQCAVAVQVALATENVGGTADEAMQFRIGVHVGDVMVDGSNLLGDCVNIAARLESLTEPGAICVSAIVRDQVGNKLPVTFDDLGDQQFKNIAQTIRVPGANRNTGSSIRCGANHCPTSRLSRYCRSTTCPTTRSKNISPTAWSRKSSPH